MNLPEAVTSSAFLAKLIQNGIAANAKYYADEVRNAAHLRELSAIGSQLIAATQSADVDPLEIAKRFLTQLEARESVPGAAQIQSAKVLAKSPTRS